MRRSASFGPKVTVYPSRGMDRAAQSTASIPTIMTMTDETPRYQDKYTGAFLADKRHGHGRMDYQNGDIYDGEWVNDMRHGHGRCVYANEDVYEGEWKNDKRTGQGVYRFANGDEYEGIFLRELQGHRTYVMD